MSPKEGDEVGSSPPAGANEGWTINSSFWNRLNTLPVVQSTLETTKGIYSSSRERAIIGKGLGYLEYGVTLASNPVKKVATSLVEKYPLPVAVASSTATKLDTLACGYLETLENKVPVIQKPPKQIVTTVKRGASTAIHSGVRKVMKTFPGQQVVKGLDAMIVWSEVALNQYDVDKLEEEEKAGQEASEGDKESSKKRGPPMMMLKNGVVIPLKLYLQILKVVKHMMANMAGVRTRPSSTSGVPRKPAEIHRRKKASPKKRLPKQGLVNRMAGSVMSMLGLHKQDDVVKEDLCLKLKSDESESASATYARNEKRKHDDLTRDEDDSDSDAESLNLASALDHYNSEDDSDYVPDEEGSDVSLEYNSGDTESDLEDVEDVGRGKKGEPLKQLANKKIKDAKTVKDNPPKTNPSGVVQQSQQVAPPPLLQPEWKNKPEQTEPKS